MANQATKAAEQPDRQQAAASLFPLFVKLQGRACLVVGAGSTGESKIKGLLESGAKVRVVATLASEAVAEWALSGQIAWEQRNFQSSDLDGQFLVVVATSSRTLNQAIFREARQRNILCNAVDDPEHCDFYYPAVVRRGALQIAISTDGLSPALAQRLRRELEVQFGPQYAGWLQELGEARKQLFSRDMEPEARRKILHQLASHEAFAVAQSGSRLATEKHS
jgi:precorrin-2 dehydrogenase/sirohydrochlorin ferrochelatase